MTKKEPLLLLHGVTCSAAIWDDVVPLLADRFELIVPTAPGHRGGPPKTGKASVPALIDATDRLLTDRGYDRVHIAGNSMGGWMAIELARRGRALSACALSPAGFWTVGADDLEHSVGLVRRNTRRARATSVIAPLLHRSGRLRRVILRDLAEHGERITARQAADLTRDVVGCDAADDILSIVTDSVAPLHPLPCPVTLAWSENDRIFPPHVHGVTARERIPGAKFVLLPRVGHVPMIDDPALCATTIAASTEI